MRTESKYSIAYDFIKSRIIHNEYRSGEIISENKISSELGMSRTPVREALKILDNDGYVDIHKGVGIVVRHITMKEVLDINAVRIMLECFAIKSLCKNGKYTNFGELLSRWYQIKTTITSGKDYSRDELLELDAETHLTIIACSNNDVLVQMFNNLDERIRRYQKIFTNVTNDDVSTINQHIKILAAIKNADADEACSLLEKHINTPMDTLINNNVDIFIHA